MPALRFSLSRQLSPQLGKRLLVVTIKLGQRQPNQRYHGRRRQHHFYAVKAVNSCGASGTFSNRPAEFEFDIVNN